MRTISKTGATRLGFALMLKYIEIGGEFPRFAEQIPPAAVEFVAELVKVEQDRSRLPATSRQR